MQQFPTAVTCFRNNTTGDNMQQFPTAVTCSQVRLFRELPIIVGRNSSPLDYTRCNLLLPESLALPPTTRQYLARLRVPIYDLMRVTLG
ncbi:hypothetical protein DPMN_118558 [Dreissena polymorpha]|uniref:Uncharacterized protein n=1 Tax=Dreissena polymorpha TaxID=45954 RepID=A0A9D4GHM3_DREPO|nr:hypothetical protein DPMN_118558 [Dreissena polymorpha]